MAERIDLLMNKNKNRAPRRLGDIKTNAPYVMLSVGENANTETVLMPMPVNISSGNQALWDQTDFSTGEVGAASITAFNKGSLSGSGFIDAMKKQAIGAGATGLGALAGVSNGGDYIRHTNNVAVNPNKEMTFNGIGYRSFSFEFELIPLNKTDAKNIKEFVKFVQLHSMPDLNSVYFSYPDVWKISFPKTEWLPVIMDSYCTQYNISYGGAGKMVSHDDSSVQTNIALTFTERDLHTKSKIRDGYVG